MNQKNSILFILFTFFSSLVTYSQDFKLILTAGLNASQVNGDKLAGFDKLGFHAGAGILRNVGKRGSIQFELLYAEKGSKDISTDIDPIQDTLFRFNYIEIPLMYNYAIKPFLRVQLGPYTGVLIKASFDNGYQIFDRTNDLRKMDYGLTGGLDYRFYNQFSVSLRISQSMLDINKTFERYFNLVSSLGIRYTFQ